VIALKAVLWSASEDASDHAVQVAAGGSGEEGGRRPDSCLKSEPIGEPLGDQR